MTRHLFLAATAAAFAVVASPAGAATLIQYEFTGQPGNQASTAATNVAGGLMGLAFTRGPGLTGVSTANSINASGWSTDTTTDYYDFGFTVAGTSAAIVNQLTFGAQSSATGPGTINVLANIDGGGFNQVGSFTLAPGGTNLSESITFATALTAASRAEFRFVDANTTAAGGGTLANGGTFRVTDTTPSGTATPFTISGSFATTATPGAVPEPAAWVMMIGGFGLAGTVLRRRAAGARRFA